MAKKQTIEEHILHDNLEDIMSDRFARYSKYIIQERALPDARDGLKPVQRRILYAMYEDGNTFNKPYRKSAKTVGNVIGNYHPHGDISVYEAMVRLSQNWKITNPLVDMQGNNGSIDDDPAAAMRYTEARLSEISSYLLEDIDKDTVEWAPNFSDEKLEPTVLPARYPNLLTNGITGIASGYATNIPPHNLNEVVDACIYRIQHANCTLEELMQFVKGPDFPTGGIVMGLDGIKQAFQTGRGKVMVRSKVRIEQTRTIQQIVIYEIPYDVVKSQMVKKIDEIRLNKKIDGLLDVRDESDRTGLRVVIDVKKDIDTEQILNYLYKNTDLQVSYNYNMIAIVDKAPVQMSLADSLDAFIKHREDVVLKRSKFDYEQKSKRAHIVDGLIRAVSIMDEIIHLIRQSKNKADAKKNLIERFDFSEQQAEAIVTMRLYRLTNTDVKELKQEQSLLKKEMKRLHAILTDVNTLHQVLIEELEEINAKIHTPRLSEIQAKVQEIVIDKRAMVADEMVMVPITRDGYIKKVSMRSYNASNTDPTGMKDSDSVLAYGSCSTLDTLLFFTNRGTYGYLPVYEIEEGKWKDLGSHLGNYIKMDSNEKIIQAYFLRSFNPNVQVIMASQFGMIKRSRLSDFEVSRNNKSMVCMKIGSMDQVVSVTLSYSPEDSIAVVSQQGYALQYSAQEVAMMTLRTKGVKAMNLGKEDCIADVTILQADKQVLLVGDKAQMKRLKVEEIAQLKRPAKGNRLYKWVKSNPVYVKSIYAVEANQGFDLMSEDPIHFEAKDISLMNASATFSTPFGKLNEFTIQSPLTHIQEGFWPEEEQEAYKQGTLFE
ncbi:DNA topoisomerase IV subunit A [Firmicutes bacterium AM41-11]|nr:DNA topoisomerase IV subunit A [Firmicutes bacterium AM41-11]